MRSLAPFTVIGPRRAKGDGKTHVEGGWDCYLERYLYSSIKPSPYALFGSSEMPPNGQNFYYVDDKEIDRSLSGGASVRGRMWRRPKKCCWRWRREELLVG